MKMSDVTLENAIEYLSGQFEIDKIKQSIEATLDEMIDSVLSDITEFVKDLI